MRFYFDRNSIRLVQHRLTMAYSLFVEIVIRYSFYLHPCEEIKLFP